MDATPAELEIGIAGTERIDGLEPLWLALQRHHRAVSSVPVQPDDRLSWQVRRACYHRHIRSGDGFLVVAGQPGTEAGYAMVLVRSGPDDTYPFAGRFGEVVTLVVSPGARGRGIGNRLLDAVDAELARRGIHDQIIAVMAGNAAAQRLYERRGFAPGEVILFRMGAARDA
jgi:ribosomal protein S18 acetylase RimI-like enzyme